VTSSISIDELELLPPFRGVADSSEVVEVRGVRGYVTRSGDPCSRGIFSVIRPGDPCRSVILNTLGCDLGG